MVLYNVFIRLVAMDKTSQPGRNANVTNPGSCELKAAQGQTFTFGALLQMHEYIHVLQIIQAKRNKICFIAKICMSVFIISFKLNACIVLFHVIVPFIYSFMYYRKNCSWKRDSQ